jgi:hypothetical protein
MNRSLPEMTNPHCHLCGATLRRPEQFHELARPDRNDIIYLCRDETRCATRATFDPPSQRSAEPQSTHERLIAQTEPIRVHQEHGSWQVDYGSYAQGYHRSREEAIEKATTDAARENRELTIEAAKTTG